MTENNKLLAIEQMSGESDRAILSTYLMLAESIVLNRLYPYGNGELIPPRYDANVVEIACYLLNKRGAEGQTSHNENGVSRGYESASVPASMLKGIVPIARVVNAVSTEE